MWKHEAVVVLLCRGFVGFRGGVCGLGWGVTASQFVFDPGRGTPMLTGRLLWSIWWRLKSHTHTHTPNTHTHIASYYICQFSHCWLSGLFISIIFIISAVKTSPSFCAEGISHSDLRWQKCELLKHHLPPVMKLKSSSIKPHMITSP